MAITVCASQARAFITTVRPFTRPSRPISRNVRTRVSPTSIDIMHHFDVYSTKISILLSFFTMSKLITRAAEDSVNSYDSSDSYDGDDDDTDDGELIPIKVKEDHEK
jgi:hypothetical protein